MNLVGLTAVAALFAFKGVLNSGALPAAGALADPTAHRHFLAALLSAIAAGAAMTVFTWVAAAAETAGARIAAALMIGFLLAAPSLNHAIVGFGELIFGLFAGTATTTTATWRETPASRSSGTSSAGSVWCSRPGWRRCAASPRDMSD